jgi:uncharacterized protein (DUF58 family)
LLTDHVIAIGSRTFTVTTAEQFVAALVVLFGVVLVAALIFSRRRVVTLKRSSGTEQVAFELSRIADALERIANRPADRVIEEASRREVPMAASAATVQTGTPGRHSMFGF